MLTESMTEQQQKEFLSEILLTKHLRPHKNVVTVIGKLEICQIINIFFYTFIPFFLFNQKIIHFSFFFFLASKIFESGVGNWSNLIAAIDGNISTAAYCNSSLYAGNCNAFLVFSNFNFQIPPNNQINTLYVDCYVWSDLPGTTDYFDPLTASYEGYSLWDTSFFPQRIGNPASSNPNTWTTYPGQWQPSVGGDSTFWNVNNWNGN